MLGNIVSDMVEKQRRAQDFATMSKPMVSSIPENQRFSIKSRIEELKNNKNNIKSKMEEDYNWNLILKVVIPFALIEAYIFYTNISNNWKWFSLIMALLLTGGIVYFKDKKRSNIFTAVGIVFLVALIVRFLKNFGII